MVKMAKSSVNTPTKNNGKQLQQAECKCTNPGSGGGENAPLCHICTSVPRPFPNLMARDGSLRNNLLTQLHNLSNIYHSSYSEFSLPSQNSYCMFEPCNDELWPPAMASNPDASLGSTEPANNVNKLAQSTDG